MTSTSSDALRSCAEDARAWSDAALDAGWLSESDKALINSLSGASSADLFDEHSGEPLVVALFGGTGVGKSSLLNRLVGEAIARVGVIRPTSLEATVYVHESVTFSGPPRSGFQRSVHQNNKRRNIVWVDMPDVDSTAEHNRQLVLEFLPFVDVLIYVVSPERYRDEAPWRLLSEHAKRSAWVFVMNQIDRGRTAQIEDLERAVVAAGFADPVLFATSCGAESALDHFDALAGFIDSLAEERLREAIQEQGHATQLRLLAEQLQTLTSAWPADSSSFEKAWLEHKNQLTTELKKDLVERLAPVAARMAKGEAAQPGELWDDWATERVSDALAGTQLDAREQGWSKKATAQLAGVVGLDLADRGESALRESVHRSLAQPGGKIQRAIYNACGWLQFALPLLALVWAGWFVVNGFYEGATGKGAFVAEGFAMNALLLAGLGFGLPWLLGGLIKPSPRKAAILGVRNGLGEIIEHIDQQVLARLAEASKQLQTLDAEREKITRTALAAAQETRDIDPQASDLNARLRKQS